MTDIAGKMGLSTAAATGLVDRIEKLGCVERVHASEDRRKVMAPFLDGRGGCGNGGAHETRDCFTCDRVIWRMDETEDRVRPA